MSIHTVIYNTSLLFQGLWGLFQVHWVHLYGPQFFLVGLVGVLWHINHCKLFNAQSSLYIYLLLCFALVLWHISYCRLLNAKSFLYKYIGYIWFGLVGFYGISTIVGYLMASPLNTYILNIYYLVCFGLVLWHINHCRLFRAKSSLYTYIEYISYGSFGFYGISTIVGYLMPNLFLNIYWIYVIWFSWVLWHTNHCRLFNTKSFLYIYIDIIWFGLVLWHINHYMLFNA